MISTSVEAKCERSDGDVLLLDVTRLLVQRAAGQTPTGIDRVCLAYVRQFGSVSRAVLQVRYGLFALSCVLSKRDSDNLFGMLRGPGRELRKRLAGFLLHAVPGSWRQPCVRGAIYLNVGHTGIGAKGYGRWLSRMGVKPVFLVHDLIPITHPEYCSPKSKELHVARMETVLNHGVGVIANSQESLKSLREFATERGATLPPAVVALLGVDLAQPKAAECTVRPVAGPYFVVVGTIEGRKNHLLLLKVWRKLARVMGSSSPRLIVIGRRGWEAESATDLLDRCEPLRGVVVEHSSCSDAELVAYLKHARALLFPSHIEGYGLPLVEALGLGTPVLASDLAVFREIAQAIPDYIDPLDGLGWLKAVQDYAEESSLRREQQLIRMRGYRPPKWSDHFDKVDGLLGQLR